MPSWYEVNFQKGKKGNTFFEGETLKIKINKANVDHISGAIYKNGFPVIALFGKGNSASVKVARKGKSLKGVATLKVRGYIKTATGYAGFGIDDAFDIV